MRCLARAARRARRRRHQPPAADGARTLRAQATSANGAGRCDSAASASFPSAYAMRPTPRARGACPLRVRLGPSGRFGAARCPVRLQNTLSTSAERVPSPSFPHSLIPSRCSASPVGRLEPRPPRRQSLARSARGVPQSPPPAPRATRAPRRSSAPAHCAARRARQSHACARRATCAKPVGVVRCTLRCEFGETATRSFSAAQRHCRGARRAGDREAGQLSSRTCSAVISRRDRLAGRGASGAGVVSTPGVVVLSPDDSGGVGVGAGGGDGDGEGEGMPRSQRNARPASSCGRCCCIRVCIRDCDCDTFRSMSILRAQRAAVATCAGAQHGARYVCSREGEAKFVEVVANFPPAPVRAAPCRATELHFVVMLEVRQCGLFRAAGTVGVVAHRHVDEPAQHDNPAAAAALRMCRRSTRLSSSRAAAARRAARRVPPPSSTWRAAS